MKLGDIEFGLADVHYDTEYGDDTVLCYGWPWVRDLIANGFQFKSPWDDDVDVFAIPISIYNAAKLFTEQSGYAGMSLAEFVRKMQ